MIKNLSIIILILFSVTIYGQDIKPDFDGHKWEAPYSLPIPIPKDWTIERFPIPISFAPQILYKGVEDIRFTPGWAKVKSDEYWSYAFLWYLEGEIKMDSKILDRNLKTYVGTIKMIDYMAQKSIVLNCKAHLKSCSGENKTLLFYELSPQLLKHNIWLSLDKLWLDFKCKKD